MGAQRLMLYWSFLLYIPEVFAVYIVMLFKCSFNVEQGAPPVQRDLAFIEEFWSYKKASGSDTLRDDFGCSRLYGTCPDKVYYVIDIAKILGPAPITPDPAGCALCNPLL